MEKESRQNEPNTFPFIEGVEHLSNDEREAIGRMMGMSSKLAGMCQGKTIGILRFSGSQDEDFAAELLKETQKSKYAKEILEVVKTLNQKGDLYRNEPMQICPRETIHNLILMKAYRILETRNQKQKKDSIVDLAAYGILALYRENNDKKIQSQEKND